MLLFSWSISYTVKKYTFLVDLIDSELTFLVNT